MQEFIGASRQCYDDLTGNFCWLSIKEPSSSSSVVGENLNVSSSSKVVSSRSNSKENVNLSSVTTKSRGQNRISPEILKAPVDFAPPVPAVLRKSSKVKKAEAPSAGTSGGSVSFGICDQKPSTSATVCAKRKSNDAIDSPHHDYYNQIVEDEMINEITKEPLTPNYVNLNPNDQCGDLDCSTTSKSRPLAAGKTNLKPDQLTENLDPLIAKDFGRCPALLFTSVLQN
uniref:Uncharacterized protein n=1 Tax=Romanomermis culicivorax TaxID=13658 RepID=A0A915ITY3_ROMCU